MRASKGLLYDERLLEHSKALQQLQKDSKECTKTIEIKQGCLKDAIAKLEVDFEDRLDKALQKEQKARLAVEEQLDKACDDLKSNMDDELKESHAALRMELISRIDGKLKEIAEKEQAARLAAEERLNKACQDLKGKMGDAMKESHAALHKELTTRSTIEERLEKACNDLKGNMGDALKESHATLRMELAAHGKNADEMKAAMQEAHLAK